MQMKAHKPVGVALRTRREQLGLSREALGAVAGGISSDTVARAEAGTVKTNRATKFALARALGCEVEELFPTNEVKPGGGTPSFTETSTAGQGRHDQSY
jgi:DNA-binding XRE family transcriptional regulator